ncbi:hypothetical protein LTR78_002391 [Recurvomyces mirabilis]|uniref:Ketoreductase domain-containing protein n=1 Tax=Recurvomyces mirabilis TaxID=574656 RepID=A0AAE0WSZ3_9PEZI|nr:hypothetical protein LTR78_002391 [Recurvomyces mirabilis]KAK5157320.1 hypothetical protein LTS14_004085 [Recurvomyces mirabilis]
MQLSDDLRILVTGGSGFLGASIVAALLERHTGWRVSILDLRRPSEKILIRLERYLQADIADESSVKAAFKDYHPDLVIHTAGIIPARQLRYSTRTEDWERVKSINYDGTRHVLAATLTSGCRRFVYTSSCTTVIDDLDHDYYNVDETVPLGLATLHYGKSKTLAEQHVLDPSHAKEYGLLACALRPCTIIGPGDPAVIALIHDLIVKRETNFIIGDGDNLYDWMYIDNAVLAHILAAENLLTSQTAAGEAFFISNQEPAYFWDFLAAIWAEFDHVPRRRWYIPVGLAWVAGWAAEWVTWATGGAATLDRGSIKDGIRTVFLNNDKARSVLGYVPVVGLAEGVRLACDDFKKQMATRNTANGILNEKTKG